MTVIAFLTGIYLGLTFTILVNGQYVSDGPRNYFTPQLQPINRSPSSQPYGQQVPSKPQASGLNSSPQVTNPPNALQNPSFSSFPPQNFNSRQTPDLSSGFPQHSSFTPPPTNQPASFSPQNPISYKPSFTPQRSSSGFTNPQQTRPFQTGTERPGSMFANPQQTIPFSPPPTSFAPQNPVSYNPSFTPQMPRSSFNNPQQTRPFQTAVQRPDSMLTDPQQANRLFNRPQQTIPYNPPTSFTRPPQTIPFNPPTSFTRPPQTIPFSPPTSFTRPSTVPYIVNPSTLRFIPNNPSFTGIQQSRPSYINPRENIPTSLAPQQPQLFSKNPQMTKLDAPMHQPTQLYSTSPQVTKPNPTTPQQFNQHSTTPQQTNSESAVSQPAVSELIVVPQKTDTTSTDSQKNDSDSSDTQVTNPASTDVQPISSSSEQSINVSSSPQYTRSVQTLNEQPPHASNGRSRSSNTRYRPHSEKKTDVQPHGDPLKGKRIVCLFNTKHFYKHGFTPAKLEPHLCTHLNYEFAILDPKTYEIIVGEPELDIDMNFYEEAIGLKRVNPKLNVLMSLGGWSDSTKKYSELADDPEKRANFIQKAVEFLTKHGFDGMDLAWEYPNCWQGAIGVSPKDKPNFVTLLKETKEEFKEHNLLLSVSVGAVKREVDAAYDVQEISDCVDYINVMTYDMHGPWELKTSHHVQFDTLPGDTDPYCNVKGGMQVWIEKGASKNKLNMGLAFYGRTFQMKDPNKCEIGVPAIGPGAPGPISEEGGILSYHEICNFLNSGNWTEKENKQAGFYACCEDQFASYDPPLMMVRKAKYVVESDLGGVLLKDLSGDDSRGDCFNMPFPLLKMVRMEMIHKIRQTYH